MAVSTGMSCLLSSLLSILLFAGMQLYKVPLASSQLFTIIGGFLASIIFILALTAVSNLEVMIFGKGFQTQIFPEVVFCLLAALFSAGTVHRVCVTTCFIFSMIGLHYVNKISNSIYAPAASASNVGKHK